MVKNLWCRLFHRKKDVTMKIVQDDDELLPHYLFECRKCGRRWASYESIR